LRRFEEENALAGKRVKVTSKAGNIDLGLGTYLWMGEILLDTGKKIDEKHCTFEVTNAGEVPPLKITLLGDTRVFKLDGGLVKLGVYLEKGDTVLIDHVGKYPWNHGGYVAGRFGSTKDQFYLLMSEVELLEEKPPHLRLVKAA
jgi:hypothetical protein